ncbi:MAG: hypothetical protein KBE04_05645 [Phycisphaerae bacterium]|nr:hypothetical protein [Phycisphaerae bacterium]
MGTDNLASQGGRKTSPNRAAWIAVGMTLGVAAVCFTVLALLPPPKKSLLQDPLRSILTGVAVMGLACPLVIAGRQLKRRFAASPYYEGGFIAGVLSLFGYVVLSAGLACIGFGLYDVALLFLDTK